MKEKVAVIGVHGVGIATQYETARRLCALLQTDSNYTSFQERELHLGVEPLPQPKNAGGATAIYERVRNGEASTPEKIDHDFMAGQINLPKGASEFSPGANYRTVRIEGKRGDDTDVHVYEMFWSDLSTVGTGIVSVLGELFQLLFHLPRIGSHTVSAAALCEGKPMPRLWRAYALAQEWASQILSRGMPLLTLLNVIFGVSLIGVAIARYERGPGRIGAEFVNSAIPMIVGAAIVAAYLWMVKTRFSATRFLVPAALYVLLVVLARVYPLSDFQADSAWAFALVTGFYLLSVPVVRLFDRRFPKSAAWYERLAPIAVVACEVAGAWSARTVDATLALLWAQTKAFEWSLLLTALAWVAYLVLAVLAGVLGFASVARARKSEWQRVARVEYTARLTLALPAFLLIGVTLLFWALMGRVAGLFLNDVNARFCSELLGKCVQLKDVGENLLNAAGREMIPLLIAYAVIGLAILLWALTPSLRFEYLAPDKADRDTSVAGGLWLSFGFKRARLSGELIYWGVLVLLFLQILRNFEKPLTSGDVNLAWRWAGALVGATGAGLLVAASKFSSLTRSFRPILKTLLDVDNWLREHPAGENPTAKICARYAALLKFVQEEKYDKLVIVAHSQGTAITADFLRYAKSEQLHLLNQDARSLLTVGSPLRQLYAKRFPHLYGWVENSDGERPDPQSLGICEWKNAYRSGDYVGRCIWHESVEKSWVPGPLVPLKGEDICLGQGAHTHYFDSTAIEVRRLLDGMITGRWRDCEKSPAHEAYAEIER